MKGLETTEEFKTKFNAYLTHVNETYYNEQLKGFFYLVYAGINSNKVLIYKNSFHHFYHLKEAIKYCEDKLYLDWTFDLGEVENLSSKIYICFHEPQKDNNKMKEIVDGYFKGASFYYTLC